MMGRKLGGYWLRNENWFFNWNVTDGGYALFDMQKDPLNNKNLVDSIFLLQKKELRFKIRLQTLRSLLLELVPYN